VAVDPVGNATAVWSQSDGTPPFTTNTVQARRIGSDSTLGATLDVSASGASGSPQVAVDAAGNAIAVWEVSGSAIQARRINADGTLGTIQDLAAPPNVSLPAIAVDPTGNATVAWQRFDGIDGIVQARRISPDGTLGPTQSLSLPGGLALDANVAVDAAGRATVVWGRVSGTGTTIQARRIAADGTLDPTVLDLSGLGSSSHPAHVAVDASGNATAVWKLFNGANNVAQARRIAADGSLGPLRTLSAPGFEAAVPDVAVDPAGRATAVWVGNLMGFFTQIAQTRSISADGTVGTTRDLAPGPNAGFPKIAVDSAGNATAAWTRSDGTNTLLQTRRIALDGTLGATQDVSATGFNTSFPGLAVDPAGDATFVWVRSGATTLVQAAPRPVAPVCQGASMTTAFQTPVKLALPCQGIRLVRQIVVPPVHGALGPIGANGTVTYTPSAGYVGPDLFVHKGVNEGGDSGPVVDQITVGQPAAVISPAGSGSGQPGPGSGGSGGSGGPGASLPSGRATAVPLRGTLAFIRGWANEPVRCDNVEGDVCRLSLSLVRGPRAGAAGRHARHPRLAKASAAIPGGETGRVTWTLTTPGKRALRRGPVTAVLAGTSRNRAGVAVSVAGRRTLERAPRPRRR
jgi:hypothetical protein